MFPSALVPSWGSLAIVAVSTAGAYLGLIALSRIAGLRSFAQMTNFDVAATIAFGSIVATTSVSASVTLLQGLLALAVLFGAQGLIAHLRKHRGMERIADNRSLLLMRGTRELTTNLNQAQMTRNDLYAKLRLAGVTHLDQVEAVVLETTGEVSVLKTDPDGARLDPRMLTSVDDQESGPRTDLADEPPEQHPDQT